MKKAFLLLLLAVFVGLCIYLWQSENYAPEPLGARRTSYASQKTCHAITVNSAQGAYVLPDPACTPGKVSDAYGSSLASTVCNKSWSTKEVRPPTTYTTPLKMCMLTGQGCDKFPGVGVYDYSDKNPADYELDHLIPLTAGGDPRSVQNLWPQPYSGDLGAHEKDKAELNLHNTVCGRASASWTSIDMQFARNWTSLYKSSINLPANYGGE